MKFSLLILFYVSFNVFSQSEINKDFWELKGNVKSVYEASYRGRMKFGEIVKSKITQDIGIDNHYLVFDKNGRLVLKFDYRSDSIYSHKQKYFYSNNGVLILKHSIYQERRYIDSFLYVKDYIFLVKTYSKEKLISTQNFSYNGKEKLVKKVTSNYSGSKNIEAFQFYENGIMSSFEKLNYRNDILISGVKKSYDSLGYLVEIKEFDSNYKTTLKIELKYNKWGKLVKHNCTVKPDYHKMGVKSRNNYADYNGVYKYDNGDLIWIKYYNIDSDVLEKQIVYTYNENKLLSDEIAYVTYFSTDNDLQEYSHDKYEYDGNGNLLLKKVTSANYSTSKTEWIYDEFNNWVNKKQYNNGKFEYIIERKIEYYD